MVSERKYFRMKFVYLLPEQWWWEASGVALRQRPDYIKYQPDSPASPW